MANLSQAVYDPSQQAQPRFYDSDKLGYWIAAIGVVSAMTLLSTGVLAPRKDATLFEYLNATNITNLLDV
jgi:hypothetical protein